ncbi:MAG: MFS transporter [Armatimonadota bacterium]|nr:MFS transporter [Armatimonadota bacterium]
MGLRPMQAYDAFHDIISGMVPQIRVHRAWVVLGGVTLILLASSGLRSSFGVFIKPLEAEFGWSRVALSVVASLSLLLYGAMGPLVGRIADRFGPRGVLMAAALLLGAGTMATSRVTSLWHLYLAAGVITAMGAGSAAMSVAASLAARWFDRQRGLVLGIAGAGMAAGQLLVVPALMAVTTTWGWRASFLGSGVVFVAVILPLVVLLIRNDPREVGLAPYGAAPGTVAATAEQRASQRVGAAAAARTLPFWLLAGSFWVCGYTTSGLVLTHLIPHAAEGGFHAAMAAQALGVMGALNIVGTIASGWICDRLGPRGPLAAYYLLRGVSLVFLPFVGSALGLFGFAAIFGLNYISTVPATTALTARIYGRYSVGELSGWIFFSHQIGAAAGSLVGGYFYRAFGDYTLAFHTAALLAFAATGMVLLIQDRPQGGEPALSEPERPEALGGTMATAPGP